jgi:hypothetical protein
MGDSCERRGERGEYTARAERLLDDAGRPKRSDDERHSDRRSQPVEDRAES